MKIKAFTSDLHFYHTNIITYCNRPFFSTEHMNEQLVKNYNNVISPGDHVVFVGDIFFCGKEKAKNIMACLNGSKTLVRGNHDKGSQNLYYELGFDLVVDNWLMLEIENTPVRVCHYPYFEPKTDSVEIVDDRYKHLRPPKIEGEILLHGHTHQKSKRVNNQIHVGVDANGYKPILYDEIIELIKQIKLEK